MSITELGANYIFEDLGIEFVKLPTGGYQAVKEGKILDQDATLKLLARRIVKALAKISDNK